MLERGTHVFARGRKQPGVVHQAGEKRVDGFHAATPTISWIIARKLIPNAGTARRQRSFNLRTNVSPAHVSSMAQTFTSTSPRSRPAVRTTPSERSVVPPDAFFGQATHSIPFGSSLSRRRGNPFRSADFDLTKRIAKSRGPFEENLHPFGSAPSDAPRLFGGDAKCSRLSGFIPSLSMSGVPEYPTV